MRVFAIDPGPERSGWVTFNGDSVLQCGPGIENACLAPFEDWPIFDNVTDIACEWIEHYGKDIHPGAETFHTCRWIGRFQEAALRAGVPFHLVTRREVKLHLCGNPRAKDAQIRTAILDRFGGSKAKGTKATPGPLYGVSGHTWSALAVALTFSDRNASVGVKS